MQALTSELVKQAALGVGFDLVGIASASDPMLEESVKRYAQWVDAGLHSSMDYLRRHAELKADPEKLLAGWKSVLCVGLLYGTEKGDDGSRAQVSLYTRGKDYHLVISEKLATLTAILRQSATLNARPFVDSEPVFERFWAWRAGLGWIGKNSVLIHRKQGSYLFLGGLLLDVALDPDAPQPDHCGRCTKCIEACPTDAILESKMLDSAKCIAYHTIENRGPIAEQIMAASGRWIAGCDICQDVCPWNDPVVESKHFETTNAAFHAPLVELAQWTEADFKSKTADIAMARMKYPGFLRNLTIAITNSDLSEAQKSTALTKIESRIEGMRSEIGRQGLEAALGWAKTRVGNSP